MITIVTPTCDRPEAFALCERWVKRQSCRPHQWIVADGGSVPATCTMGQIHIHDPKPAGALNFINNLRNGVNCAEGDVIVFFEDDEWYRSDHLECLEHRLRSSHLSGGVWQRYYNVAHRQWRIFRNHGSSLCQTGMRRSLVPAFLRVLDECETRRHFGVDGSFWSSACPPNLRESYDDSDSPTVCGIKGIAGQQGLGVGHRPDKSWTDDPDLHKLRQWIGDDADTYARFRNLSPPSTELSDIMRQ